MTRRYWSTGSTLAEEGPVLADSQRRLVLKTGTLSVMMLLTGCAVPILRPGEQAVTRMTLPDSTIAVRPTLRVIAPSSPLESSSRTEQALARFASAGFVISNREALYRRYQRFAGTDNERLADLNGLAALSEPLPDLIIPTRAGYGSVRLLDRINYQQLCPRLKAANTLFFGYSDVTALQLALLAQGGVVTFSGPMLHSDFGAPSPSLMTLDWFRQVLTQPSFELAVTQPQAVICHAEGTLWGGNLAVLTQLVGTPWMPYIDGGILFLEDVGEALHRIERLLFQLFYAGILSRQKAILLGHFNDYKEDFYDAQGYRLETILAALQSRLAVPILTHLPVGHVADIVSLPIGGRARVATHANGYTLTVDQYPFLSGRFAATNWTALRQ